MSWRCTRTDMTVIHTLLPSQATTSRWRSHRSPVFVLLRYQSTLNLPSRPTQSPTHKHQPVKKNPSQPSADPTRQAPQGSHKDPSPLKSPTLFNDETRWPWRPVTTQHPEFDPKYVDEERTIFSRPTDVSKRPSSIMFVWGAAIFVGGLAFFAPVGPPPNEEVREKIVQKLGRWAPMFESGVGSSFRVGVTGLMAAIAFAATWVQSRSVIRLDLLRRTFRNARVGHRYLVRLTNENHLIRIPFTTRRFYFKPRLIPLTDISVRWLAAGPEGGWLRVNTTKPFPPQEYRLHFTDAERLAKTSHTMDLVLSVDRLEAVFGNLLAPSIKDQIQNRPALTS